MEHMEHEEGKGTPDTSDLDLLFGALKAAQAAFDAYLEDRGFDPSFWELEPLVGHILSTDFKRYGRIVYDPNENTYIDEDEVSR